VTGAAGRNGLLLGLALALAAAVAGGRAAVDDEVAVSLSSSGLKPATLRTGRAETLRVVVSSGDEREHCFAVDALRVEKRVRPGRPVSVDLTSERSGSFPIHCCLHPDNQAERGQLVVGE
jgi:hypothetical protein